MRTYSYPATRGLGLWVPWPCWVFNKELKMAPEGWTLERVKAGLYRLRPRKADIPNIERTIAVGGFQWFDQEAFYGKDVKPAAPSVVPVIAVSLFPDYYEIDVLQIGGTNVDHNFSLLIFSAAE